MGIITVIEILIPIIIISAIVILIWKFKSWFCRQPILKTLCGKIASRPCQVGDNVGNPTDKSEGSACEYVSNGESCYLHARTGPNGQNIWQCDDSCSENPKCQRGYSPHSTDCTSGQNKGVSSLDEVGKACKWLSKGKTCFLHVRKANDGTNRWVCDDNCAEIKECCESGDGQWDSNSGTCLTTGIDGPIPNKIKPGPAKECGKGRNRGILADEEPEGQACSWESHGQICYLHAQSNTWDNKRRWVCDDSCVTHKSCCDCKGCKWDHNSGRCITDGTHLGDLRT